MFCRVFQPMFPFSLFGETNFTFEVSHFNPRRHSFASFLGTREGGGGDTTTPRIWLLIELELPVKNERAGLQERKLVMPILGSLVNR